MRVYFLIAGLLLILPNINYSQCHNQCYGSKPYLYTNQDEGVFNAKELWRRKDAVNIAEDLFSVDIDNDGIPELISHIRASNDPTSFLSYLSNQIRIFNINSGSLFKSQFFSGVKTTQRGAVCIAETYGRPNRNPWIWIFNGGIA